MMHKSHCLALHCFFYAIIKCYIIKSVKSKIFNLLEFYTVWIGSSLLKLWDHLSVSYSRVMQSKKKTLVTISLHRVKSQKK